MRQADCTTTVARQPSMVQLRRDLREGSGFGWPLPMPRSLTHLSVLSRNRVPA